MRRSLKGLLNHPNDIYPILKLKLALIQAEKQIPWDPHWRFCYSILHNVSRSFALVIQQLHTDLRNAVCVFYLVLRALDTVEDDTSIDTMIKIPILMEFHHHIYDPDWHFECGTQGYKILMDQFHHVSTAFLELNQSYREVIEDVTMRMGAGMAKFTCKEVETIKDYDEYSHYVAGLVGLGLSKLFYVSGKEVLFPDSLSNSMGLFLQDLKHEEHSEKAVQCLNDMVTNTLIHIEDCLKYMSDLHDPAIFKFCAIPQIMAIGTLALCYNNIEVFRGVVKLRRVLTAKVIDRTKTMADVYGAFYDFSLLLRCKVNMKDPNAHTTISRIESAQKIFRDSGTLTKRKSYITDNEPSYGPALIAFLIVLLAILYAYLSANRLNKTELALSES